MRRNKEWEGASISEKADLVDRCHNGINLEDISIDSTPAHETPVSYSLALEWSPDYSPVANSELRKTTTWKNAAL